MGGTDYIDIEMYIYIRTTLKSRRNLNKVMVQTQELQPGQKAEERDSLFGIYVSCVDYNCMHIRETGKKILSTHRGKSCK